LAAEEGVAEEVAEDEVMAEGALMDVEDAAAAAETVKGTTGAEETTEVAIATGAAGDTRTTVMIVAVVETTMVVAVEGALEDRGIEAMSGDSLVV